MSLLVQREPYPALDALSSEKFQADHDQQGALRLKIIAKEDY